MKVDIIEHNSQNTKV